MNFKDLVAIDDETSLKFEGGKFSWGACSIKKDAGGATSGTHFASGTWDVFGDSTLSLMPEAGAVSVPLQVVLGA